MTTWTPEAVRELRTRLNLDQKQFAVLIGCAQGAVSMWEAGKRTPRGLYAKRLDEIAKQK